MPQQQPRRAHRGRVEGRAKVTGAATYSAEYRLEGMAHGVLVGSDVAAGRITSIETADALAAPGVLAVLSHLDRPDVPAFATPEAIDESGFGLPLFHTDEVRYFDQYIALVVADSFEDATYAASLVTATYDERPFEVDFERERRSVPLEPAGDERGALDAWQDAEHVVDAEYRIATQIHSPMEPHATIAEWTGPDRLKLYDKSQGVNGVQWWMGRLLDIPSENVEVNSEFVGGGFGSGLIVWPHTLAAALAAQRLNRPVRVVLTRQQMFTQVGARPQSWQRIRLGCDASGTLRGLHHQAQHSTSEWATFRDNITRVSRKIYTLPNLRAEESIVPLNIPRPIWMRGPGDASGQFAVESAIDELCYQIGADPVAFRLQNIADIEQETGLPWSSNFLAECIRRGAEEIDWSRRPATPGSLRDDGWATGYGHAVGLWNASRRRASASVEVGPDGRFTVRSAMTDIGTGTGTGMMNVARERLGVDAGRIDVELGHSRHPDAPSQGGSWGMASVSGAVVAACDALVERLAHLAWGIPEADASAADYRITPGGIAQTDGAERSFADVLSEHGLPSLEVVATAGPGGERDRYGFVSSAAHFVQVRVHEPTGRVDLTRMVSVVDGGRIINPRPAANQIIGAAMGAIGMGLQEEQEFDLQTGAALATDFASYHFAVNADAPIVEVSFIDEPDPHINPSGAKGIGEVGLIGTAAAIANAIYNATGRRLRKLPMLPSEIVA